jgi:hypothetical protein
MSGIIHFTSGKTLKITQREMETMAPKLQAGGIRMYRTGKNCLIPLNSNTMEFIESVPEDEPTVEPKPETAAKKPVKLAPKPEEKTKGDQGREDDAMKELLEKSNCKHEPEKLSLYVQHTAKGVRYFPVCSFCGKRERYVSEKKIIDGEYERWAQGDILTATPWTEE